MNTKNYCLCQESSIYEQALEPFGQGEPHKLNYLSDYTIQLALKGEHNNIEIKNPLGDTEITTQNTKTDSPLTAESRSIFFF